MGVDRVTATRRTGHQLAIQINVSRGIGDKRGGQKMPLIQRYCLGDCGRSSVGEKINVVVRPDLEVKIVVVLRLPEDCKYLSAGGWLRGEIDPGQYRALVFNLAGQACGEITVVTVQQQSLVPRIRSQWPAGAGRANPGVALQFSRVAVHATVRLESGVKPPVAQQIGGVQQQVARRRNFDATDQFHRQLGVTEAGFHPQDGGDELPVQDIAVRRRQPHRLVVGRHFEGTDAGHGQFQIPQQCRVESPRGIQAFPDDVRAVPQFKAQAQNCFIGGSRRGWGLAEA